MTILGWLSDLLIPFNGLSDLQSGDKKITLNHLVVDFYGFHGSVNIQSSSPRIRHGESVFSIFFKWAQQNS